MRPFMQSNNMVVAAGLMILVTGMLFITLFVVGSSAPPIGESSDPIASAPSDPVASSETHIPLAEATSSTDIPVALAYSYGAERDVLIGSCGARLLAGVPSRIADGGGGRFVEFWRTDAGAELVSIGDNGGYEATCDGDRYDMDGTILTWDAALGDFIRS